MIENGVDEGGGDRTVRHIDADHAPTTPVPSGRRQSIMDSGTSGDVRESMITA
jgi:hypothetical protein